MECLTNIVGVTQSDCVCIVGELTEDEKLALAVSKSGLYLDNLPGGLSLKALDNLDACKKMSAMALTAITNAAKQLEGDLIVALNNRYTKAKGNFIGQIGQLSYAGTSTNIKAVQGMLIRTPEASDAIMTVNKIFIMVNANISTTIKVIKALSGSAVGVEVASFPVDAGANSITTVITEIDGVPLKLKLSEGGRAVDYYFVYERLGAFPKDNKIDCNCDKSVTNTLHNYVTPMGVGMDEMAVLSPTTDKQAHGLVLDVTLKCNNAELVCREYDASEAISTVLAYAVWHKAGELLIEEVQKSPEVNRYTSMNREYLWGKRNHFKAQYEGRVNYLSTTLDISSSNCFICKNDSLIMAPIYATDGYDALNESEAEAMEIKNSARGLFYGPQGERL